MHINNLTADQIAEINAFLANSNNETFDENIINFFNTLTQTNNDPLGLIGHSEIGLRGQIIKLDDSNRYAGFVFPQGQTPEVQNALYCDALEAERDQYSDEDFETLCSDNLTEYKAKVPHHVLLLNTTNITGIFDLVFLNSEFKPIGMSLIKLKYL